jgi:dipeptidyl aminopeptidase/acylaminoacyl peptidase
MLDTALLVLTLAAGSAADDKILLSSEIILAGKTGEAEVRRITYRSDGLTVNGYLAVPKQGTKLPCLIFNRGGNPRLAVLDDDRAAAILGKMAGWGYVVAASQYRGADGAEGNDEYGGADVDDVLNLIPVLETVPRADTGSIGMVGASRGGMMSYLALARTDRIAAAVINSGLADLNLDDRPEMVRVWSQLIPDYAKDPAAKLAARSAVHFAGALPKTTPILILHGTSDWRAKPKTNAIGMAAALMEAKLPFRLVLFEGAQHGLSEFREEADRMTREWLDRYVKEKRPWPSLEPHGP